MKVNKGGFDVNVSSPFTTTHTKVLLKVGVHQIYCLQITMFRWKWRRLYSGTCDILQLYKNKTMLPRPPQDRNKNHNRSATVTTPSARLHSWAFVCYCGGKVIVPLSLSASWVKNILACKSTHQNRHKCVFPVLLNQEP